mgnify:CR=1 FL=1
MALVDFERDLGNAIDNLVETHVAMESGPYQTLLYLRILAEIISKSADRLEKWIKTNQWEDRI